VNQQQGITPSIVVVGAGLAGSLLALALARRGTSVALVGSAHPSATVLSYGGLPGSALRSWRRLERWHGPLGYADAGQCWRSDPWWELDSPRPWSLLL